MTTTSYIDPRTLSATARDAARATACADPSTRVTRSLAGYGVIAGPVYVGVSLAQALTRDGFDLGRHAWSQLADRRLGLDPDRQPRRDRPDVARLLRGPAPHPGRRSRWPGRARFSSRCSASASCSAGVFPADPAAGFPVGMATPSTPSLHGTLHLMTSGVGFLALAVAMVVMAVRYAAERRRGRSAFSVVAAAALLGGFGTIASGVGGRRRGVHDRHHHGADLAEPARRRHVHPGHLRPPVNPSDPHTPSTPQGAPRCVSSAPSRSASSPTPRPRRPSWRPSPPSAWRPPAPAPSSTSPASCRSAPAAVASPSRAAPSPSPTGRSRSPRSSISYAVYDVRSRDEALEWATRFVRLHQEHWAGWEGEADVQQVFEAPPAP